MPTPYFRYTCPNPRCQTIVPGTDHLKDSCPECGTFLFPTRDSNTAERSTFRLGPGERFIRGQVVYSADWL